MTPQKDVPDGTPPWLNLSLTKLYHNQEKRPWASKNNLKN